MTKRTHQGNVCEQCPPNVRKVLEPRAFEDGNDDSPSPSDSPMTIGVDADRFNTTTNLVEEMLRDTIDIKSSIEGVKNKCRHGHKRLKHQLAQLQRDLDDRVEDNPSRNEQAGRRGNLSQQEDGALAKRIAQLKEDNEELARENVKLQKANRGYVEKILDIQPHRYELLPDAAAEQYGALVSGIDSWVSRWVCLIVQDESSEARFLRRMTETPSLIAPFGDIVKREAEFSAAAALPDCEVELLGALISRYLHDELFTRPLYGPELPGVAFISAAAASMAKHTEPRKDPSAIRAWTADAYHALLAAPESRQHRERALARMTGQLADLLGFLAPAGEEGRGGKFRTSLETEVVGPALRLREAFLSTAGAGYGFALGLAPAAAVEARVRACRTLAELARVVDDDDLDLRVAAGGHGRLVFRRLRPPPTNLPDFRARLRCVCTLHPSLVFESEAATKKNGKGKGNDDGGDDDDGDGGREESGQPVVLEKQRVLVSWVPHGSEHASASSDAQTATSWIYQILQARDQPTRAK